LLHLIAGFRQDANIRGIKNAPEGFRDWAIEYGAVEMDRWAWWDYLEKKYGED